MAVRKLRASWWVDFRFKNQRYRKRSPANSKLGAESYEAALRQKLARGESLDDEVPKSEELTFGEFAKEWMATYVRTNNKPSEQKTKQFALQNHLLPYFAELPLKEITAQKIEQYKSIKVSADLSAKTVNNHLNVLMKCLHCAVDWGRLIVVPKASLLKTTPPRFDFLSPEEAERLIEACHEPMWPEMVLVALHTGLRLGELFGLEWQDVDFERGMLTVRRSIVRGVIGTPKNHKIRYIPLTQKVLTALHQKGKGDGLVFPADTGKPLTQSIAYNAIRRFCKKAGLRMIGWHVLRHTFASRLTTESVPMTAIQQLMGHSSIVMTMRYAHLAPSTLRDAVAVLDRPKKIENENFGQQAVNIETLLAKINL